MSVIRDKRTLCYTEQVVLTGDVQGVLVDVADTLSSVLIVLAIALVCAALYVLRVAVLAIRDIQSAVTDTRERLVPLIDKADVTLDVVNAEILRLDHIVTQVEEVGQTVSTAGEFIRSPVNSAAYRIAKFARGLKRPGQSRSTQSREGT